MNRFGWGVVCAILALGIASCSQQGAPADSPGDAPAGTAPVEAPAVAVTYTKDIAPMFDASCANCHGGENMKGGLSLASFASAIQGGESGAVIVPGDADGSMLFRMVTKQEEPYMPRKGDPLTAAQIDTLRQWIVAGAPEG